MILLLNIGGSTAKQNTWESPCRILHTPQTKRQIDHHPKTKNTMRIPTIPCRPLGHKVELQYLSS